MIPAVDASELGNYFLPYGDVDTMKGLVRYPYAQHYDDQVYGVACDGVVVGIVFNKKVFEEAGITELPKTPDEVH